ncbi:MAG: type II toxin-antitoxin system VapC family toxin [Actinomycetota bacterium]|nr:type II toxin-antitoxin system VapC family toxin [Actinomycetota bacterium]
MDQLTTLVDTSVLVGGRVAGLRMDGGWAVSAVSVGELDAGVLLATHPAVRAARLRRLTAVLAVAPVLDVDRPVAARFGELRAAAGRSATSDLWIAATALAHDLTLVTADERQAALPLIRTSLLRADR